jgi:uncharacterized lipoprotein YajG
MKMRREREIGGEIDMKRKSTSAICAIMLSGLLLALGGCASQQTTTTTTRTTPAPSASDSSSNHGSANASTTTTSTTTTDEPSSVLGATAHAVATIVMFPIRLIGDAIALIV